MPLVIRYSTVYKLIELLLTIIIAVVIFSPTPSVTVRNALCINIAPIDCFTPMILPFVLAWITFVYNIGILIFLCRRRLWDKCESIAALLTAIAWFATSMIVCHLVPGQWVKSNFKLEYFPGLWQAVALLSLAISLIHLYESTSAGAFPAHYNRIVYPRPLVTFDKAIKSTRLNNTTGGFDIRHMKPKGPSSRKRHNSDSRAIHI